MGGVGLFSRDFRRIFSLLAGHVGNMEGSTGRGDSCGETKDIHDRVWSRKGLREVSSFQRVLCTGFNGVGTY